MNYKISYQKFNIIQNIYINLKQLLKYLKYMNLNNLLQIPFQKNLPIFYSWISQS
jgi:hypothetical protein